MKIDDIVKNSVAVNRPDKTALYVQIINIKEVSTLNAIQFTTENLFVQKMGITTYIKKSKKQFASLQLLEMVNNLGCGLTAFPEQNKSEPVFGICIGFYRFKTVGIKMIFYC